MDRDILTCERNLVAEKLPAYYSSDYMVRAIKACNKSEENPYRDILREDFLDGTWPIQCHNDKNAVAACFKEYVIESIKTQGNKVDVKITYSNGDFFYTILKLVRENGQWKLDDVSLIDENNKGTDYDESRYSIKAEIDKAIARIDKKKSK